MKSKILSSALAGLLMLSSCSDFLEQTNTTQANENTFYDSDEAVAAAVYPLYNYCWNNFNNKFSWAVGDGRANNITAQYSDYVKFYCNFTETSLTEGLEEAWGSLYLVVSSSNNVINAIRASSGPSENAKIQGEAEARFMRGVALVHRHHLGPRHHLHRHQVSAAARHLSGPPPDRRDGIRHPRP